MDETRITYLPDGTKTGVAIWDAILETRDYLPFGTEAVSTTGAAYVTWPQNRWRYEGKETLPYTPATSAVKDFGARSYDPYTARWLSPDPKSWDYTTLSPYAFCAGDPMGIVDPDGNDIWRIDEYGTVWSVEELRDYDVLQIVRIGLDGYHYDLEGARIEIPYGAIEPELLFGGDFLFELKGGDLYAQKVFEFLAVYSSVEWSLVRFFSHNPIIGTSHMKHENATLMYSLRRYADDAWLAIHSHPNSQCASGPDVIYSGIFPRVTHSVFYVPKQRYIFYDYKTKVENELNPAVVSF